MLAGAAISPTPCGLVAQLDRALDYESRGQGFESSPVRHLIKKFHDFRYLRFWYLCSHQTANINEGARSAFGPAVIHSDC